MRKTYTILTLNNSRFSISQQFLQLLNVYSIERDDKGGRNGGGGGKLNVYQFMKIDKSAINLPYREK